MIWTLSSTGPNLHEASKYQPKHAYQSWSNSGDNSYPKNTITGFLDVAGDGEIAFLPARHVEARLLLGPQHGELARH